MEESGRLVLDRDTAERIVLALWVALPVVGHLDTGQGRVTVEDDPEEVVGLTLVPIVGGVYPDDGRNMWIGVRHGHFQSDPAVVRDRSKWIYGVELATGVLRIVDSIDTQAKFEAQFRFVAQSARDLREVRPFDMQRHLVSKDHYPLDCIGESAARAAQCGIQGVRNFVEVSTERSRGLVLY